MKLTLENYKKTYTCQSLREIYTTNLLRITHGIFTRCTAMSPFRVLHLALASAGGFEPVETMNGHDLMKTHAPGACMCTKVCFIRYVFVWFPFLTICKLDPSNYFPYWERACSLFVNSCALISMIIFPPH